MRETTCKSARPWCGPAELRRVVALTHTTKPIAIFGLPAIRAPCGFTASEPPMSFQLVGRPFSAALPPRRAHAYQ